jgi:hypothetical protein
MTPVIAGSCDERREKDICRDHIFASANSMYFARHRKRNSFRYLGVRRMCVCVCVCVCVGVGVGVGVCARARLCVRAHVRGCGGVGALPFAEVATEQRSDWTVGAVRQTEHVPPSVPR